MDLETLMQHLKELRLPTFAKEYIEVARQCEKLQKSYEQYLAMLAKMEVEERKRKKALKYLREAKFPLDKDLEDFDFEWCAGITRQQAFRLAEGEFIKKAENITFFGCFGIGKSHLAIAIAKKLCEKGFRCFFTTTHALINQLEEAQKSLTLTALLRRLDKFDLIVLDELGYTPQGKEGADLFFQFISERYERKSLMITTNLTYSEWDQVFLNPTTTQAAVDRIIHRCQNFSISGKSFRAEEAKKRLEKKP